MVKITRDMILPHPPNAVFRALRRSMPDIALRSPQSRYKIEDEIEEKDRFYRRASIHRPASLERLPPLVRTRLPPDLISRAINMMEESIFYEQDDRIQWTIVCPDLYSFSGNTRFLPIDRGGCRIIVLFYFDLDLDTYLTPSMQKIIVPVLQERIPDIFWSEMKSIYENITVDAQDLCSSS